MSRGPGKTQRAICDLLAFARSVEPWPVFMSAIALARHVYRTESPSTGQLETVRRACRTSPALERDTSWALVPAASRWDTNFRVDRPLLVARLAASATEDWLWRAYVASLGNPSWRTVLPCADRPGYQPPDPDELAAAVEAFARREEPPSDALTVANSYSGTALGPADLARWAELRARDEEERQARRQDARPARPERLRLGPYFVAPDTVPDQCPCCRQPVDPTEWDIARFQDT
ncbi:hypothetical protein [Streptomyces sp. 2112.2]|uniref:hypothetical protein n=1 Tax=Streptomyces sp. 2112.2 TaxID=1881024 RepID=UPI00115F8DAA|nr:hypothetical protein [Streptomyces sp. 2112.2]